MTTMLKNLRNVILLAIFFIATAAPSCATTSGGGSGTAGASGAAGATPSPTVAFGHCSTDAVRKSAEGLLGKLTTALATGDYAAEAAKLGKEFGAEEIGCALDLIIGEFTAKADRTNDTQTQVILAHARALRGTSP